METKERLLKTLESIDNEDFLQKIQMELDKHQQHLPTIFQELAQQKHELVEIKNQLNKFLQIISFDLGSPINSLKSMADLLKMDIENLENPVVADTAGFLFAQIENLQRKMGNLILWASFEVKNVRAENMDFDLVELIKEEADFFEKAATKKSIAFFLETPQTLILRADKLLIRTLIENLLSNAVKFSRKNDKIWLKTYLLDQKLHFEVVDTGVGISAAKLSNIFNVGRIPQKGTANESGLGLGLVLCRAILKVYDTELFIDSQKGQNTRVGFELKQ